MGLFLRDEFFSSILRQEVGYFDDTTSGKIINQLNSDIEQVRNATSDKVATFFFNIGQAISGVIVAFIYAPALTGVLLGISPLMVIGALLQQLLIAKSQQSQAGVFAEASSFASETFRSFRLVAAYTWQGEAAKRYAAMLQASLSTRNRVLSAFFFGLSFLLMFSVFAIAM